MSDVAICIENLGKKYRIGGPQEPYKTLRDSLAGAAKTPFRRVASTFQRSNVQRSNAANIIWALKDVSFEVRQGEVVGIIGRNGAGKSTLLKILSRITEPTEGQAEIHGRIGSLLEVGTGFHPELTGRENIYLNGSILGMRKVEIQRKFDEIVEFAEIEKFLDTPVKRYSSGMYVRLAFAVAAHLEPEIMLVDEVLAVGDAAFQKKCLGKMGDVAKEGRTVFFVSHNLPAVGRMCTRGIYLTNGTLTYDGSVDGAIATYTRQLADSERILTYEGISLRISLSGDSDEQMTAWKFGENLVVRVHLELERPLREPAVDLAFYSENGVRVFAVQSDRVGKGMSGALARQYEAEFVMPNIGFAVSELTIDVGIRSDKDPRYIAWWQRVETVPVFSRKLPSSSTSETIVSVPVRVKEVWQ